MDRNSQQSGFGFKVFRKVFIVVSVFAFFTSNSLLSQSSPTGPFPIQGSNDICVDAPITYSTNPNPVAQYNWRAVNGQIISGQGTSAATAVWSDPGTNKLILEVQLGANTHRDTTHILTSQPTPINMGPDGALCGQGLMLTPGPGFTSYLWQSGGAADSIYPQVPIGAASPTSTAASPATPSTSAPASPSPAFTPPARSNSVKAIPKCFSLLLAMQITSGMVFQADKRPS
jgi:hypothetical protein